MAAILKWRFALSLSPPSLSHRVNCDREKEVMLKVGTLNRSAGVALIETEDWGLRTEVD